MERHKAALLSICSNSLLITLKLIAGIVMGSVSVISEAIHSFIDLIASIIAFFSIKAAEKPEDKEHPFGHGKYENISGFVEALLILLAAVLIIYESIKKIISGVTIENVGAGMFVMLISAIVNLVISISLIKISKKTNSIALEADGYHLLTDFLTAGGVFLGLTLIKITGLKILDPVIAIIVATFIFRTSIKLIKKSSNDLLDATLPDSDIKKITDIVNSQPEVTGYHKLRTRRSGSTREIDLHILLNGKMPLIDAHSISKIIEDKIKKVFPDSYIVVHVEPDKKII